MARDRHRCRVIGCGSARFLEIHHIVPRKGGGGNEHRQEEARVVDEPAPGEGAEGGDAAMTNRRIPSAGRSVAAVLASAAISSYTAMNFTGASTFTSPTGVEVEMRKSLPYQAGGAVLSLVLWVVGGFIG